MLLSKKICSLGFDKNYCSPKNINDIVSNNYNDHLNPDHNSLLSKAIKLGNIQIIEMLIKAGIDVNKRINGRLDIYPKALIVYGPANSPTPLLLAITSDDKSTNTSITELLFNTKNINLSQRFTYGEDAAFDYAKGQPEIEKLLFKKLQEKMHEKDSLNKVEKKHYNRYMKNAMNDIFKDVKAQTRSMDINNNSNDAHIKIIDEKAKEYFPSLKGNTQYDKALKDMFDEIKLAKSKDKEASKNTLDAIVKFFEKLLRFVTNNSIEKEAFKKLETQIIADIAKPDKKEVDKQASKSEGNSSALKPQARKI